MQEPRPLEELIRDAAGLRRLAVELVGDGAADDVVQDALLASLGRAPAEARAARAWLQRVVRNLAASRHRSTGRRADRERRAARDEALPGASELVERMEVQRVVAEEVLRLEEPYRSAILAVHFEGLAAEAYARARGVPGATVRSWTKRGLDALRVRLDQRFGGDRSAWSACLLPLVKPAIPVGGAPAWTGAAALVAVLATTAGLAWWLGNGPRPAPEGPVALSAAVADRGAALSAPASGPSRASAAAVDAVEERAPVTAAPARGAIAGRVVWKETGRPAVDVGVRFVSVPFIANYGDPELAITDVGGVFSSPALPPGDYQVTLDRSTVRSNVRVSAGETTEVTLEVPTGRDMVGRVLGPDGEPVAGASIWLRESNSLFLRRIGSSAADGSYVARGLDRWSAVFARCKGYTPSGLRQCIVEHEDLAKSLLAEPILRADLYLGPAPGRIEGRVLDAAGTGVPGAFVRVADLLATGIDPAGVRTGSGALFVLRTDAEGRFLLDDAAPGPHALYVLNPGHSMWSEEVAVLPGRTTAVEIRLPHSARLSGRVVDATGRPLQGTTITAKSLEVSAVTSIGCDADGRYDTGWVPAGRVRATATHKDWGTATLELDLAPGAELEWSPTLPTRPSVAGRVVDLEGRPVPRVSVQTSLKGKVAETDEDGRFRIEDLPNQQLSLFVFEGETCLARVGRVWSGDLDVTLVLERPTARVIGRLLAADGAPLQSVSVACDGRTARTGPLGEFEIAELRSGHHEVGPSKTRLRNETLAEVDLAPGALVDVGELVLPGTGSLRVHVSSSEGVPLGWASPFVRRVGPGFQHKSARGWDDRGTWQLDELPAGDYELDATGSGVAFEARPFRIEPGLTTELAVDLRFGSKVPLRVRIPPGAERPESVSIEARASGGGAPARRWWEWRWREESELPELWLRPGRYEVVATTPDGRGASAWVTVPEPGRIVPVVELELR